MNPDPNTPSVDAAVVMLPRRCSPHLYAPTPQKKATRAISIRNGPNGAHTIDPTTVKMLLVGERNAPMIRPTTTKAKRQESTVNKINAKRVMT
jgi:hypothetical protein